MPPILRVRDLSVSFDDHSVLEHLDFDLESGDSLAIIGPNGSGKTVLLRSLMHLIPFQGSIEWRNDARLGYVPQKIDADRHIPITLLNLLEAKMRIQHLSRADISEVTELVELSPDVLQTPIGHLSGGQFQKALIGFALLGHPSVLLCDEPTASLDELASEHVYELLERLNRERGITIVLVTHDLSVVPQVAKTALCLNKSMICYGKLTDTLTSEIFEKMYHAPHRFYQHVAHELAKPQP